MKRGVKVGKNIVDNAVLFCYHHPIVAAWRRLYQHEGWRRRTGPRAHSGTLKVSLWTIDY